MTRNFAFMLSASLLSALLGCSNAATEIEDPESEEAVSAGKADSGYSSCELSEIVAFANSPATTFQTLRSSGIATRAANNVLAHRAGADRAYGTGDDNPFDDIEELDGVSHVGIATMRAFAAAVEEACENPAAPASASVIFSPQPYETSHAVAIAELIDQSERSLDIAMYSFSDANILNALTRAVSRGVSVRMVFEPANGDHLRPAGTMSENLEKRGVDVRYVNRIMHHKFVLIDGPREGLDAATRGALVTGSGNWSNGAATRYDENTVFLRGNAEANLAFQREFNRLWENSRDFAGPASAQRLDSRPIAEGDIPDHADFEATFTSDNFDASSSTRHGATFSTVRGRNTVSNALVELIGRARRSIRIATGHFASRPVAEALVEAKRRDPNLDIQVYIDGQEYLSASAEREQVRRRDTCLAEAGESEAKQELCEAKDFIYGYTLHAAGIDVRYKTYAYRWNVAYAAQMHHKYFIVDDSIVASGSYNLSDNAEHNTMENMVFYEGPSFAPLAESFVSNFRGMWDTGRNEGLYDGMMSTLATVPRTVPIVFPSMALTWDEVTDLRSAIRQACPAVDSAAYRQNAPSYRSCTR